MPIDQVAERLRKNQERAEAAELQRLINAYRKIIANTTDLRDALILEIAGMEEPTPAKVLRLQRYKRLIQETEAELSKYETYVRIGIGTAADNAIRDGQVDARTLVRLTAGEQGITAGFRTLPPETIRALLYFLDPDGPLYKRLALLPGYTSQQVADAIINGVGLGRNPKAIAREITRAFGMGLTDSMRMMRTVQIWSYREANRASYLANSDVVKGWQWMARLDGSVCCSCAAMHGSIHKLDEPLNDHHNGRCAMLPIVIGGKAPLEGTGKDWFDNLSEAEQRAIMGGGRLDAYKAGRFDFSQLSTERMNEIYGAMRSEATLKELVGEP